jgi:hypothetical protein
VLLINGETYLRQFVSKLLNFAYFGELGCALTDGTFSIVFAKQNVRTPRVACRWLKTIAAAQKTGNEQHCTFIERCIVAAGGLSTFSANAVVRDHKPAP